jgi:hypothetical protein
MVSFFSEFFNRSQLGCPKFEPPLTY